MIKGIYVHIPFCSYKCPYCDFLSLTNSPVGPEEYVELLKREFSLYKDLNTEIRTVYFGGGTPTYLKPELIGKIIEELDKNFNLLNVEEITVECNPETYRESELKKLKEYGVNRVSVGVQSFTEKGLKALGRKHTLKDTFECLESLKNSGIENINIDLIYGWSGQENEDIYKDIEFLKELDFIKHVSWYMLTIYENTKFGKEKVEIPDEKKISNFHKIISEELKNLGFKRYEISNWAKEGYECKHNLIYWKLEEFLGFGVSAWGFYNGKRYGNTRNMFKYKEYILKNLKPIDAEYELNEFEIEKEFIILSLRLTEGLPKSYEVFIPEHLKEFFEINERIKIKEDFLIVSNELISEFLKNFEKSKALIR